MSANYPRHLGAAFADAEVARSYRYRQPYPPETFDVLAELIVEPRVVLDVGSGTGALTGALVRMARRVDALDPSEAMIHEARRELGKDARIRWIVGRAEDAPLDPPYGLITAGASIHWMDPEIVMPRFGNALAPGGRLAIVDTNSEYPRDASWRSDFIAVIQRYSPVHHDDLPAFLKWLEASGHFAREGERMTAPVPYEQSVDDYMTALASTSSLSRVTLGDRADGFAREARSVLARHGVSRINAVLVGSIVWGRPR